jgi:hypothetical protein
MVNMMKNEYRPVFSTMMPCSARYLVTMAAGMPRSLNSPSTSRPGVMIVALIGSQVEAFGQIAEAVPALVGLEHPVFALRCRLRPARPGPTP